MTSKDQVSEKEARIALLNTLEEGAREYNGQSASNGAHVDIAALGCIQGPVRFVHSAFLEPIILDTVVHTAASEPAPGAESSKKETRRFIH